MKYKTRGNASPQGMQKVYFTGHPEDCKIYFESISEQILSLQNCAIFYDDDPERPDDPENFLSDLECMKLVVIVVTSRYINEDTFAHNSVFRFATEHDIPVLPILEESGIEKEFNEKCGNLQYLNPNSRDTTELGYEEKLKRFLESVLVGDELAEMIRRAFDAYVFLSYRKKDRQYAQKLMRLIHSNDFCRDIAIWYDEYLVPGENFNKAIEEAMEKSRLFALAVTPNLLEKPNYILKKEYPDAKEMKKNKQIEILPVTMVPTDEKQLSDSYEEIPKPIDAEDTAALGDALRTLLKDVAKLENDSDPQHIFFIGLAYLGGIDVEIDHERALKMITFAAEHNLPEAVEKLVNMYLTGDGVRRSYEKAAEWQRRLADLCKEEFDREQSEPIGQAWIYALWDLGDYLKAFGRINEAEETYLEMLAASRQVDGICDTDDTKRSISISYNAVGDIYFEKGNLPAAKEYHEKSFEIDKRLAEQYPDSVQVQRDLSASYINFGNICKARGELSEAKEYYEKSLEIRERLAALQSNYIQEQSDLSIVCEALGDICVALGELPDAETYYEKDLEISKSLAEMQPDSFQMQRNLCLCYDRIGDFYYVHGDLPHAKMYYENGLKIRERLAENQQDSVPAQRDLTLSCERLGYLHQVQGELPDSKAYYERVLEIRERLANLQQDSGQAQRDLSMAYARLGDICTEQGKYSGAEEYFEKSIAIRERLAEKQPDSADIQTDLIISYSNIGDIYRIRGDLSGAETYYKKCLKISARLAKDHPDSVQAQRYWALSCERLGIICEIRVDLPAAKEYHENAFKIRSSIAAQQPDSVESQRDLALGYGKLGYISQLQEDIPCTKAYYEKSHEIFDRLAKQQPDSVQAQRDLFLVYESLGYICQIQGDLPGAKEYYEKCLEISELLAEKHDSVQAQRDLSVSLHIIGEICELQGDFSEAGSYYKKGLEIRERLADCLKTPQAYEDEARSYFKVALVSKSQAEKKKYLRKAKDIMTALTKRYPDIPDYAELLKKVKAALLFRFFL